MIRDWVDAIKLSSDSGGLNDKCRYKVLLVSSNFACALSNCVYKRAYCILGKFNVILTNNSGMETYGLEASV